MLSDAIRLIRTSLQHGVDTFVVYYLINDMAKEIYFNDQRFFWFSVDWKKIIKKFNEILG